MSVLIVTYASQSAQTVQFTKGKRFTKSTPICARNVWDILINRNALWYVQLIAFR